jgi:hypothetical protein
MKNPFIKESNNTGLLIAGAVTGVIAAGAAAWYYIKRATGKPEHNEHALDYLQPAPVLHKKKTDLHDLHTIASGNL